jgi:hypothetical protein
MYRIYWFDTNVRWKNQLRYTSSMKLDTIVCTKNPEHASSQRWRRPLKLIGPVEPFSDFEWSVYSDVFVRREIATSLKNSGFTGIHFDEVEYYSTTETPFGRDALELRVQGWGGMAPQTSGVRVIEQCPCCNHQVFTTATNPKNLFDPEIWDGSDFFIIWPLPRYIFVTQRVRDMIQSEGWSGPRIRPIADLAELNDRFIAGTLSPGHLEDWFDKEKADQIRLTFPNSHY